MKETAYRRQVNDSTQMIILVQANQLSFHFPLLQNSTQENDNSLFSRPRTDPVSTTAETGQETWLMHISVKCEFAKGEHPFSRVKTFSSLIVSTVY